MSDLSSPTAADAIRYELSALLELVTGELGYTLPAGVHVSLETGEPAGKPSATVHQMQPHHLLELAERLPDAETFRDADEILKWVTADYDAGIVTWFRR